MAMTAASDEPFLPLIEMEDSLANALVVTEYAKTARQAKDYWMSMMWAERAEWHLGNAIGWASR